MPVLNLDLQRAFGLDKNAIIRQVIIIASLACSLRNLLYLFTIYEIPSVAWLVPITGGIYLAIANGLGSNDKSKRSAYALYDVAICLLLLFLLMKSLNAVGHYKNPELDWLAKGWGYLMYGELPNTPQKYPTPTGLRLTLLSIDEFFHLCLMAVVGYLAYKSALLIEEKHKVRETLKRLNQQ